MTQVQAKLEGIRERIRVECERFERDPRQVTLIAVSKAQPASKIREVYAAGQRDFGENYVQELLSKAKELSDCPEIRWHFIGRVQKNKLKHLVKLGAVIHGVASESTLAALVRHANEQKRDVSFFIQVNLASETQKGGCSPEELPKLVAQAEQSQELELLGLMLIPPYSEDPETNRPQFKSLKNLQNMTNLAHLSAGMSQDWHVALEEGATHLRIGSAIFGARPVKD